MNQDTRLKLGETLLFLIGLRRLVENYSILTLCDKKANNFYTQYFIRTMFIRTLRLRFLKN